MQIRLLGPVEVDVDDRPLQLGGPKQRSVLSMLALNANSTMSVGRLIEGLWGEEQPATASKMVQLYVSQLRKLLVAEGGVRSSPTAATTSCASIARSSTRCDSSALSPRLREAARTLWRARQRGALALWRGPPLADMLDEPFAAAEVRRLEELHLAAIELAIEGDLEAGRHLRG